MFDNAYQLPIIFLFLGGIDALAHNYYDKLKIDRWFFLHVIANLNIVAFAYSDLIDVIYNPIHISPIVSTYPKNITFILHLYHIVGFRNLKTIDWVHHIVMCACLFMLSDHKGGALVNFVLFFINGFPGAMDYIMLIGVKMGLMDALTEKNYNNVINTWIRSPGILIGAVLLYVHWHLGTLSGNPWYLFYTILVLYWNGIYFGNRVAVNYGYKCGERLSNNSREVISLTSLSLPTSTVNGSIVVATTNNNDVNNVNN